MTVKPIVKAVLYALAVQKHGPRAWLWPMWMTSTMQLLIAPENTRPDWIEP